ncbi:MAG TPA: hypothetical protein VG675_25745 [Bryobacteraceae bacterium]|nr:hypothetical protein [Bryobacteraceae bacterium]
MRFRPAYISVINRRASFLGVIHSALRKEGSGLTSGNVFPSAPPIGNRGNAGTVLTVKGSLRRAKKRRALDRSAPFRQQYPAMGGSGGNTRRSSATKKGLKMKSFI